MKQTIVITGAGSGLGRGLSLSLAAIGHTIIVTDLNTESAEETAALVQQAGGDALAYTLDVASESSIQDFWQAIADHPVTALINNAGLQCVASIESFPISKWDQLNDVMVKGTFLMCQAALPGMRARGFGRIIHIGSIHSLVASPYKSAYVAAKHALLGFSKVLALETADVDITSNTICTSYLKTPLVDAQIKDQARERGIPEDEVIEKIMLAPMPKKAFITAEEVAGITDYLISTLACNLTGQTITIDGGWTAQ